MSRQSTKSKKREKIKLNTTQIHFLIEAIEDSRHDHWNKNQIALFLGHHPNTILRWFAEGKIKSIERNSELAPYFMTRSDFIGFVKSGFQFEDEKIKVDVGSILAERGCIGYSGELSLESACEHGREVWCIDPSRGELQCYRGLKSESIKDHLRAISKQIGIRFWGSKEACRKGEGLI